MNIVLDGRCIADHFPGIGRYVYNLALALGELDHAHQVFVLYNPAARNTRYDMALLERSFMRCVPIGARPFSLAEQWRVPQLLHQSRADVYHAPYYVRPYAGVPCPSVTTLYDSIPRRFPAQVSLRARMLFDVLTRLAASVSRHVITISQSARADLTAAYHLDPARITVTPLAADKRFRPQTDQAILALRAAYNLPERYVLTLAANKPHKNLLLLVEAWAMVLEMQAKQDVENVQLVLAGYYDPRYPEARVRAAQLGLAQRIRFLDNMAETDLPALYAGAEFFVFPSRYEGFGLPPLEAMACGAPVVCGAVSSLPEVVGDAAYRADITNAPALAEAIVHVLNNKALQKTMRGRGLQQAGFFSWQHTAKQTLSVYERLRAG